MKPSKVFLASIFLTAVILVIIGAVTSVVLANKNAAANQVAGTQTLQAYQEREATYSQLIEQANQQLAKANEQLQAMRTTQPAQPVIDQQAAAAPAPAITAISAEKAGVIALQAAEIGQAQLKKPELVDFQGKAAYEVTFEKGSIYVDAQSGEILFNGTLPQEISAEKAAQVAADYLNIKDVLKVDKITFRNAPIYRVIFKNGTMAYLDLTGQILYVHPYEPAAPKFEQASSGSGGGGGSAHYEDDHAESEHD